MTAQRQIFPDTLVKKSAPALLALSMLIGAALVCGHVLAATPAAAKATDTHVDTDSIISTINASERTRPFPVGEKLA